MVSTRWAFMETFEVPNFDEDANYLTRLRIVQTPWFGIFLHRFDTPDSRPTLHDHPWPFVSFILRGGYIERRLNPITMAVNENRCVRHLNVMPRGGAHSIMHLYRVPTWSLMFTGRRSRTWGYWEPIPPSMGDVCWRWTEFDKHRHGREFDNAVARRKALL